MDKTTILIVEDNEIVFSAIEAGLKHLGYSVIANVASGEDAIIKAGEINPDLILMDIELKGRMDGIETARIIQSSFDIPVIFLTAFADEEKIERAKLIMPYGYILKPFRTRDLKVSIEMALHVAKIKKEHKQMQESLKQKSMHLERTLEQLKSQNIFLQMLIDTLPISVFYKNTDGVYIGCNDSYAQLIGISKEKIIGKSVYDIFPKDLAEIYSEMDKKLFNEPGIQHYESQMENADGSRYDVLIRKSGYHDESGKVIGTIGIVVDLSDQKKAEEAIREREELLRQLFDNMKECVAVYKPIENGQNFVFVDFNTTGLLYGKKTKEQVIGKRVTDVFPGVAEFGLLDVFRNVYRTGVPQYHPLSMYKDNSIEIWVENYVFKLPSGLIVAIYQDTSDKKKVEENLKESEARYRTIIDNTKEGIILQEVSGRIVAWNKAAEQIFGISAQEALSHASMSRDWNTIHEDGSPFPGQEHPSMITLSTGMPCKDVVIGVKIPTKDIRWISVNTNPLFKENESKPYAVVITISDITERKKSESDLIKLSEAVNQTFEAVAIVGLDNIIEYANPSFEKLTGYFHDEVIGQSPFIHKCDQQDKEFFRNLLDNILEGKRWTGQILNKRKDGNLYTAECSISPVKTIDGRIVNFIWMMRDITKELDIEKKLAQAQKMEAIGTLAGGIAHDFNNILFPIVGYAEMALFDTPENSPLYHKLKEILSGAERAADLVKQILTFSRKSIQKPMPIKIHPIIKEVLKLMRSTLPKTIEIQQNICNKCGIVMADPTQIHQIAMNLITNAFHAMEENGGILKVTLEDIKIELEDFKDTAMLPGKYVCLSVEDTGIGMNNDVIEKIFDPYFTTKEDGKGTGLGLAVVHSIVAGYKGDIKVCSEPDKGSVFRVYLPSTTFKAEAGIDEVNEQTLTGSGHILIVDDEEEIVRMEKQLLELLGYQVTAQTGSAEALEIFRSKPDSFDLVISDMTMPHMTGIQLAKKLLEIRPDIPVIICTGYSSQYSEEKTRASGIYKFITKPIIMKDLALIIKEIIGK